MKRFATFLYFFLTCTGILPINLHWDSFEESMETVSSKTDDPSFWDNKEKDNENFWEDSKDINTFFSKGFDFEKPWLPIPKSPVCGCKDEMYHGQRTLKCILHTQLKQSEISVKVRNGYLLISGLRNLPGELKSFNLNYLLPRGTVVGKVTMRHSTGRKIIVRVVLKPI